MIGDPSNFVRLRGTRQAVARVHIPGGRPEWCHVQFWKGKKTGAKVDPRKCLCVLEV